MALPSTRVRTNLWAMILSGVGFILVAVFAVLAFSSQDILWFLKGFDGYPERIVVYYNGTSKEYQPDQVGFSELAGGVVASLSQGVYRPSAIGLSAGTIDDAYHKYLTVEVFYNTPVKLHASFYTGNPTQMLFLMTGRHSEMPVVFMGDHSIYLSSGPVLNTNEPLRSVLKALGYSLETQANP